MCEQNAEPDWKRFEDAVGSFLQALDPTAKVEVDVQIPDKDTGLPRQRDVWVTTSFGGHIPIKILVSCKRESAKIDQQGLDAFLGELRSSGAHVGVLYSYSGFTKPAIAKATVTGVSCCTLYDDRAPDIPDVLLFAGYCSTENVRFLVGGNPGSGLATMRDVFDLPATSDANSVSAIDELVDLYNSNGAVAMDEWKTTAVRSLPIWNATTLIEHPSLDGRIALQLQSGWSRYRAKMDAWRVNGSYSLTSKDFKGSVSTPAVDTRGSHPGPGWEEIDEQDMILQNMFHFVMHRGGVKDGLLERFGHESPQVVFGNAIAPSATQGDETN